MNWLYMTVMGYIVVSALRGFHRGFLRVVYSMAALAITVLFVAVAAPMLRNVILESTTISRQLETGSEKFIKKQVDQKLKDGTLMESMELSLIVLPKKLQKELEHTTQSAIPKLLQKHGIYKKMAKTAADMMVSVIAFFLSLLVISLILFVAGRRLDLFSRKPGIRLVNMIFGFFAGIAKAFLVIWIVFFLIQTTQILPSSAALLRMIEENAVLRGLYEQNQIAELLKMIQIR